MPKFFVVKDGVIVNCVSCDSIDEYQPQSGESVAEVPLQEDGKPARDLWIGYPYP